MSKMMTEDYIAELRRIHGGTNLVPQAVIVNELLDEIERLNRMYSETDALLEERNEADTHYLIQICYALGLRTAQSVPLAIETIESLLAERDELRAVVRFAFHMENPDTTDGTDVIGHELMPMPADIRATVIRGCKAKPRKRGVK